MDGFGPTMHLRRAASALRYAITIDERHVPVTASHLRTHGSLPPPFTCLAAMLLCLGMDTSVMAADPPQLPRPHSLIYRQTPGSSTPDVGAPTAGSSTAPTTAPRSAPRKLSKRPGESSTARQSTVITTVPTSDSSVSGSGSLSLGNKGGTETRGSMTATGLAASGTSTLTAVPLPGGVTTFAPGLPVVPSAVKAPMAGALAGANSAPSVTPGGPAAGGRGFQRLAAQMPGMTQLVAPTVSVSAPAPSSQSPSSGPAQSPAASSPAPSAPLRPPPVPPPGTGSATLSWSLNSETDLAGYKIYVGTKPGSYTYPGSPFVIGVTGTYTITALPSGQTYYFAISAYDYFGSESTLSSEVSKSIY